MRLDPQIVIQQINNLVLQWPELGEDEILRADMIESEVEDFDALLTRFLRMIADAQALADGTELRVKELQARQARFERRIEAYRALILKLMLAADLKKRELPEATISTRRIPPKVLGEPDMHYLPDDMAIITRKPNRAAIKAALESGTRVDGCELSNGDVGITITVK